MFKVLASTGAVGIGREDKELHGASLDVVGAGVVTEGIKADF